MSDGDAPITGASGRQPAPDPRSSWTSPGEPSSARPPGQPVQRDGHGQTAATQGGPQQDTCPSVGPAKDSRSKAANGQSHQYRCHLWFRRSIGQFRIDRAPGACQRNLRPFAVALRARVPGRRDSEVRWPAPAMAASGDLQRWRDLGPLDHPRHCAAATLGNPCLSHANRGCAYPLWRLMSAPTCRSWPWPNSNTSQPPSTR